MNNKNHMIRCRKNISQNSTSWQPFAHGHHCHHRKACFLGARRPSQIYPVYMQAAIGDTYFL